MLMFGSVFILNHVGIQAFANYLTIKTELNSTKQSITIIASINS